MGELPTLVSFCILLVHSPRFELYLKVTAAFLDPEQYGSEW